MPGHTLSEASEEAPMEEMFCPMHPETQQAIRDIKARQDSRKCLTNESDIRHLIESSKEQWIAINSLRRFAYMGAGATGVLAFLGSIFGAWLMKGR